MHCFHVIREGRAPTPVMEAEEEKLGIGSFTVRKGSSLAKNSLTKNSVVISYVVIMYAGTKDEILQTSEHTHQSGGRPVSHVPGSSEELAMPHCAHPATRDTVRQAPQPVRGRSTRGAIADVMSRTAWPLCGKSAAGLAKLWERHASNLARCSSSWATTPGLSQGRGQQHKVSKHFCS